MRITNNIEININIERYLRKNGIQYHMVGNNAMMCCIFHKDANPSFGIDVTTGVYHCFSGSCGAKGNIVKFVQKIEHLESYGEAESWIKMKYGINPDNVNEPLELIFSDEKDKQIIKYIDEATLKKFDFRHPYLEGRGISELWQRRFRIGYDKSRGSITIPWLDRQSRCLAIKERSVVGKAFSYINPNKDGPNSYTLFGINHVARKVKEHSEGIMAVIVEAEIDAIYLWQCGYYALALGTSHITKGQLKEFKNLNIKTFVVATDNDDAGRTIAKELAEALNWIPDIRLVDWSLFPDIKDINQLPQEKVAALINSMFTFVAQSWNNVNIDL